MPGAPGHSRRAGFAWRRPLAAGALLLLAACSTSYAPKGRWGGGYSEIELSPGIYQVRFVSVYPLFERSTRWHHLLLLRCAELTLSRGSRYFTVEQFGKAERDHALDLDGQLWVWERTPRDTVLIKIFREQPSGESLLAYDAATLQAAIRARYKIH